MSARSVDEAWQELRLHLRWTKDPWIAFVWASGSAHSEKLLDLTRAYREAEGGAVRVVEPQSPDELRQIIAELLIEPADDKTCVWLEAVRFSPTAQNESGDQRDRDPWQVAWRWLLQRLNERRERLLRALRGGLLLAMPRTLKPEVAAMAPDLWSIRSLALEIDEERKFEGTTSPDLDSAPPAPTEAALDLELARADVANLEERLATFEHERPPPTLLERFSLRAAQARAKGRLSLALAESGQYQEALQSSEQAVALMRELLEATAPERLAAREDLSQARRDELAEQRAEVFLPKLAGNLNNLGNQLDAVGRTDRALAVTQEAMEIRRKLAARRPEVFLPELAVSLNNLGNRLGAVGRKDEALAAIQEAVDGHRALAEQRPEVFLPRLAGSLNNLGITLAAVGREDEALAATQEAVDIRRTLAEERSEIFLPDLATSLSVCSDILRSLERMNEALAATREALEILRPFFLRDPSRYPLMRSVVRDYRLLLGEAGQEPDQGLLAPVQTALDAL